MIKNTLFIALLSFILIGCQQSNKEMMSDSGYRYIIHKGDSAKKLAVGDYAYFHVDLYKKDSLLNSSRSNPNGEYAKLQLQPIDPLEKNTPPVIEALRLMGKGDSLTIYLPTDSIPSLPPSFKDVKELKYDIVLADVKSKEDYDADMAVLNAEAEKKAAVFKAREGDVTKLVSSTWKDYKAGKLDGKIETTASGLKIYHYEKGSGVFPQAGNSVSVQYYGILSENGEMFDNSFTRGQAFDFPLGGGRVIRGWDEGVAKIATSGSAFLIIPSDLGYGKAGSPPVIPADAELIFYVEVIK